MSFVDPFAVLGLPLRYTFDRKAVEARHRELSRALHPDRYAGTSATERRMALSKAIEVNEAWRIVRDPIRRAEAIFQAEGLDAEIGETREPKPSTEFLMEVMEARERLDDAKSARDGAAISAIVADAKSQQDRLEAQLAHALDGSSERSGDRGSDARARESLRSAIPLLGRLRYAARLLEEASAVEERLAGL